MKFLPTIYQKSIYDINYQKLKDQGIKVLIFDLDNTLALIDEKKCPPKSKMLISRLKKDFTIYIISNNKMERIAPYIEELKVIGIANACKPFTTGLRRITQRNHQKQEMAMIGDQLVTDILSGNLFKITTIWVDPLGTKDLKITYFNRFLECQIIKLYKRRQVLERGKYYE